MAARLIARGWLWRVIEIDLPDGPHIVEYYGRTLGSERVLADGYPTHKSSWIWFVPRFDFAVGDQPARLEVRVWPWLKIRSLVVQVGDRIVYTEGVARANYLVGVGGWYGAASGGQNG